MNLLRNLKIRGNNSIFAEIISIKMSESKEEAFYKKLKTQLDDTTKFPAQYLYKFIVPSSQEKIDEVSKVFDNLGAIINTKKSKSGKYTSLSIYIEMPNSDAVILKYKEVAKIENVISL